MTSCDFISWQDIKELEKFADRLLNKVGIDIEFTRHFGERMSDARNKPCIKIAELQDLFQRIEQKNKSIKKSVKKVVSHGDDQAVLVDIQKDLNLPVVFDFDKSGKLVVTTKTIMRKKNFKTPNDKIRVERKLEPFKNFISEKRSTDIESDEGSNHIVMQIRKSVSMNGQKDVKFGDGKSVKVSQNDARKFLQKYSTAKPNEKMEIQKKATGSYEGFKEVIGESYKEVSNLNDKIKKAVKTLDDMLKKFGHGVQKSYSKKLQEAVVNGKFSPAMLKSLKNAYAGINKIDPDSPSYKRLVQMMDMMSQDQLRQIIAADVKFLRGLAQNRLKKVNEESLSDDQKSEKERIVKGMKKNRKDLIKRYGKDWKSVMHGAATNRAKKMEEAKMSPLERLKKFDKTRTAVGKKPIFTDKKDDEKKEVKEATDLKVSVKLEKGSFGNMKKKEISFIKSIEGKGATYPEFVMRLARENQEVKNLKKQGWHIVSASAPTNKG